MNLLQRLLYSIFTFQEFFLKRRLSKTVGVRINSRNKRYFGNGYSLKLEALAESERQKLETEMSVILKSNSYEPEKILSYIKDCGTEVCYINDPKVLYVLRENEGFFLPRKGFKALYLSIITGKGIKFKTQDMFILSKGVINKYYFIYHFYNWYTYKHDISGIDADSFELLNKYLYNATDDDINKLQLSDIYKLKDAINQDKVAIEFVSKLCRQYESSKKALDKIKENGASI